ncbi:hypothetical protein V6N13_058714 [Hibiscus sabdariffa]
MNESVWKMSIFSIRWSMWLVRNYVIFKGNKVDESHLFDLCCSRLAWWCKSNWPKSGILINDLVSCPLNFRYYFGSSMEKMKTSWSPPNQGIKSLILMAQLMEVSEKLELEVAYVMEALICY